MNNSKKTGERKQPASPFGGKSPYKNPQVLSKVLDKLPYHPTARWLIFPRDFYENVIGNEPYDLKSELNFGFFIKVKNMTLRMDSYDIETHGGENIIALLDADMVSLEEWEILYSLP